MASQYRDPLNLGTDELVTIDRLVDLVCEIAGKRLRKRYAPERPQGVRGRNSDNSRLRGSAWVGTAEIRWRLGWKSRTAGSSKSWSERDGWHWNWSMRETARSWLPRANVLGVGVHAMDMAGAVRQSERLLASGGKGYVCVTGVHGVMESQSDPELRSILNGAYLCVPDGMPSLWVGRLQGHREMRRVYGPDYMMAMCRQSLGPGYRHFFFGGAPGVAERLKRQMLRRMPRLRIVGTYTPPFGPLGAEQEQELIELVAGSKPDILWVGLSTPKQDDSWRTISISWR